MTNVEKIVIEALIKVLNNKTIIGNLIHSNKSTENKLRLELAKTY